MAQEARAVVEIRDFPGLFLDIDPHDASAGMAMEQVNVIASDRGELQTRGGFRFVSFEND